MRVIATAHIRKRADDGNVDQIHVLHVYFQRNHGLMRIACVINGMTLGALGSLESTGGFQCQLPTWKRVISEN